MDTKCVWISPRERCMIEIARLALANCRQQSLASDAGDHHCVISS